MIDISFTKEEAKTLLTCIDYLYASTIDISKIEEQETRDKSELHLRRLIDAMNATTKEEEDALFNKLDILHKAMAKEYESNQ